MQEEVALQRQEVTARFNTEQTIRAKMHSSLDTAVSCHQDAAPEPRRRQTVVVQTYQQFTPFLIFLCNSFWECISPRAHSTFHSLKILYTMRLTKPISHHSYRADVWHSLQWCTQHLQAHTCALQSKRKKKRRVSIFSHFYKRII